MLEKDLIELVSNWLQNALETAKVSQSELGRRMTTLDQPKISQILRHKRAMTAPEMIEVAMALKVPLPPISTVFPENDIQPLTQTEGGAFNEDLSELSLKLLRDLEESKFEGATAEEEYIEAAAIFYAMLKRSNQWNPDLYKVAVDMVDRVNTEKENQNKPFTDYVKSVAICYRTLIGANS